MKCNDFFMLIRSVTLWPWPLTPWAWTRVIDAVSRYQTTYQIWARLINPRLSYWQLRDSFQQVILSNSTQRNGEFGENRAPSSLHQPRNFGSDMLHAVFRKERRSKTSGVEDQGQISYFLTSPPVKNWGRGGGECWVGVSSILTLPPNLWYTFDGRPLRGVEV